MYVKNNEKLFISGQETLWPFGTDYKVIES